MASNGTTQSDRKRKSTAIAVLLVIAAAVAWFWASPFFAVAGLRNAALHKDAIELEKRVDFPRLRDSIKTQLSAYLVSKTTTELRDNPFAALAVALAAKLTDAMVETMITPAGLAALVEIRQHGAQEVSGWSLMFSSEFAVHRDGLDAFAVSGTDTGKSLPTLRFARYGLHWRLVGMEMPKEFLAAKAGGAFGRAQPAAPYVPQWEFADRKNPMDDTVTVFLSRGADEKVRARYTEVRPTLIFRCQKAKLEAYVNVHSMVEYDYQAYTSSVRLRFDDKPAQREAWGVSDDREALFTPSPRALLSTLWKSTVLLFEWHPSSGNPIVAKFTRGDLDAHVARLAQACGISELAQSANGASSDQGAVSYVVPIAALVDTARVRELRARLRAKGIKTYVEELRISKALVFRVRSGPYATEEDAERDREKLIALGLQPGAVVERH